MNISNQRIQKLKLPLSSCIFLLILANSVTAGNTWLDKGQSILNSIGTNGKEEGHSSSYIGAGLKEALRVGSENVVANLGRKDGFYKDEAVHIPLPKNFNKVKSALSTVGLSSMLDELELKINRAAEVATPKAKEIFKRAILEMSFDDAQSILNGPEDAATQYFRSKMAPDLEREMKPLVDNSLNEVGAIKAYDDTMKRYQSIPFMPDVKSDLSGYVVTEGISGIFYYMAKEEAAIRNNPAKRTTSLLKRVFGR